MKRAMSILAITVLGVGAIAQTGAPSAPAAMATVPPATIPIIGPDLQAIRDAINGVVQAQQNYRLAELQARYDLAVPKDYVINFDKMRFEKPEPKAEVKP